MSISQLLRYQWNGYGKYHQTRANLWLHIVAVPLFLCSIALLFSSLLAFAPLKLLAALLGSAVALGLQGRGHKLEAVPAEPFKGPLDFFKRILCEQCVTFPRFVLSGGWVRALKR